MSIDGFEEWLEKNRQLRRKVALEKKERRRKEKQLVAFA